MEPTAVRAAAAHLLSAYRTGDAVVPISEIHPRASLADAYRIQQEQVREWKAAGDAVRGHKIGLVSAAIQRQMGIDQPDYGHLTSSMFHPEHQPIPAGSFIQPRIEPEVAFVLKAPLQGPGVTVADTVRAVDFVLPALEIVDCRIEDWRITLIDTIADNASSGGAVLGSTPARLGDVDLGLAGCVLATNGTIVETGAAGAVLGSPINAVVWLANAIGAMGVGLEPGHVVLSGAITRAVEIRPGDRVTASVAGLGAVTAVLADAATSA
jgi:2-keto-4-pentenoate hydratase